MYVVEFESVVSAVLDSGIDKKKPIFFHSKALLGVEIRYEPLEKFAFVVVVEARRLHPYFQIHTIMVPSKHHLLVTTNHAKT